ncbi:MAG: Arc family DNA binding domain-containing protein [Gemmataceae bacterium]
MARKAFLLRIDPQVLTALQRWADEELRSLNGQIEYLLRQALAKRGVKLPADETGEQPEK